MLIQNHSSSVGQGAVVASDMATQQPARSVGEIAKPAAPVEMPIKAAKPVAESASPEAVKQATEMINKAIQSLSRNLKFTVDEETKENVVKVVDTDTGDVIRQIPSEETLKIANALDQLQGMLIKQKA